MLLSATKRFGGSSDSTGTEEGTTSRITFNCIPSGSVKNLLFRLGSFEAAPNVEGVICTTLGCTCDLAENKLFYIRLRTPPIPDHSGLPAGTIRTIGNRQEAQ